MAHTVDTLLELYDGREPITNVAGAWHLQPKSIVYFYYDLKDPKAERKELAQMFNRIGLRCNVRMEKLERLEQTMDSIRARFGKGAISPASTPSDPGRERHAPPPGSHHDD